ncbi:DUF5983 family protein [Enterobacter sp.]|uniref:DUF5983 family protein n=1 Tax=Enterobacter sp. TaxID=42895 RepID=UPI003D122A42
MQTQSLSSSGEATPRPSTGYGYLLRLNARLYPTLELKRMGLSKACRLVVTLMRRYSADIIHFDASGEVLPGFATFDW